MQTTLAQTREQDNGAVKVMVHRMSSKAIAILSCWIQQRAEELCCITLIYTEHPPKSSTADWLGENILDILPLKPDFLPGCELMTMASQALCLHRQDGWPSTTLTDPQVPWEGTDIPNSLTYSQNWAFLSSLHPTQAPVTSSYNQTSQTVIEVIALVCLRALWVAQVEIQNGEGHVLGKIKAGKTHLEQGKQCNGGEQGHHQPQTCTGQITTDDDQKRLCTALCGFSSLGFSLPRLALLPLTRGNGELTTLIFWVRF